MDAALESVPVRGSDDEWALYCDEKDVGVGEAALESAVREVRMLPIMMAGVARKRGWLCADAECGRERESL